MGTKSYFKKWLATLLLSLTAGSVSALNVKIDGNHYELDSATKEATLTFGAALEEVVIPASVMYENVTYTVTGIGDDAFHSPTNWKISSIVIPASVKAIGPSAFSNCSSLTSINIPEGVTHIETGTFAGCTALQSVTLPSTLTWIGKSAFQGCDNLSSVTIPKKVTSIGNSAFAGCYLLPSIIVPEGVTAIEEETFFACLALTSVTLPEGLKSIGNGAFASCKSLTSVDIPNGVTWIGDGAFGSSGLTTATLPESISSYNNVFEGCENLTTVILPEGIKKVVCTAFQGCNSLTSIICKAVTPPTSDGEILRGCPNLQLLEVPESALNAYTDATPWKNIPFLLPIGLDVPMSGDGFYELSEPIHLAWFASRACVGTPNLNARLIAPIDLKSVKWNPIGTAAYPFTGKFDGQLYPISNISNMLFGTTSGATINGVALVSGEINIEEVVYAPHNGTIIGEGATAAPTKLTNSYSLVNITSSNSGDVGGIAGKYYGTVDNCFYKGAINGNGTTGGLLGSSSEADYPAHVSNCFSFCSSLGNAWYTDGLVGWLHSNCTLDNCYAVAGVGSFGEYYIGGSTVTDCTQTSVEQFASGEMVEILGSVFRQNIGEDVCPTLDPTHGIVRKIGAKGYVTTFIKESDVMIPAGVTAYTGFIDTPWIALRELNTIPAGTAVILQGGEGYYSFVPTTDAPAARDNDLKGTDEPLVTDGTQYVLAEKDGVVGFYQAEAGTTIPAGKAYIEYGGTGVKGFYFNNADGIEEMSDDKKVDGKWYDLSGRRVEIPTKGMYIVNGKKVAIK